MIVSDDISKLSILRHVIHPLGHLIERSDLDEAVDVLKTSTVDVVIVDSNLGNPCDFGPDLRQAAADAPILLITSNLKKKFIDAALQSGITDFINEPLDRDEIQQRIAVAFRAKHRSQEISRIVKKRATPSRSTLKTLSHRDLYSEKALRAIKKARVISSTLSLLMIEIDGISSLPSATDADRHLLAILKKNLRENDSLIPQGTGKYILVLPKASKRAAEIIAETIQYEASQFPLLSLSIGLDELTPTNQTPSDDYRRLIHAAAQAFAEAKKTGNRIIAG